VTTHVSWIEDRLKERLPSCYVCNFLVNPMNCFVVCLLLFLGSLYCSLTTPQLNRSQCTLPFSPREHHLAMTVSQAHQSTGRHFLSISLSLPLLTHRFIDILDSSQPQHLVASPVTRCKDSHGSARIASHCLCPCSGGSTDCRIIRAVLCWFARVCFAQPPPAHSRGGNALFRWCAGDDHPTTGGRHRRRDLCRGHHLVLLRVAGCQCGWLLWTLEQVRAAKGRAVGASWVFPILQPRSPESNACGVCGASNTCRLLLLLSLLV
jgi:hypothetical protein